MKNITITSLFLLLFATLNAQITLDHTYNYSASVVKLETLGYKYYLMDVPNSQCKIYNLDHSLYKTINCNVPNGFYLADIKYVSENLFDSDSGIELVYTYYKYFETQTSYYYEYDSKIINDNGSAIETIDGARYIYVNKTGDNTYKLFAYCFDYSVFPEIVWTKIFNLPGEPISSVLLNENNEEIGLNAFPNPATKTVKVAYNLPDNITSGKLHLLDNNGRQLEQFIIDKHSDHLALDVSSFSAGVYHYFIEYGNTKSESKKLIIR
jgi:hypothetical protein